MALGFALALSAALLVYVLTPGVRLLVTKLGMIDYPGKRRVHQRPIPRGGGLAIYAAFWLVILIGTKMSSTPFNMDLLWLFIGASFLVFVGLLDDRYDLPPLMKLIGQIIAAVVVVLGGHRIEFLSNPWGGMIHIGGWGIPLTVLWLVTVTNMINFIDGLDGLAAGVSGIACVSLAVVAIRMNRPGIALLTMILAGSAFGFLPYNFNPARIFMGDAGAMFLGFMISVFAVDGALKGATAIALVIPVLALGVPVMDTFFAVIRRLLVGKPFYQADQGHLHHRLLALGLTQRQAVYTIYALSGFMGMSAVAALSLDTGQLLSVVALILVVACVFAQKVGVLPAKEHRHLHR
jgi:UDP-GlcNAc:undecaprenyl-phosphate GlcNAc-1-phosphate transferase